MKKEELNKLDSIKQMLHKGETAKAIKVLEDMIDDNAYPKDEVYYLLGNAYRKQSNWQKALNYYLEAIDINPKSPAVESKQALLDILNFYNKDMYNQ